MSQGRKRGGDRDRERSYHPTNQRVVTLTFASAEEAEEWDAAGQPLEGLIGMECPDE